VAQIDDALDEAWELYLATQEIRPIETKVEIWLTQQTGVMH
jgi:hypothetical protein